MNEMLIFISGAIFGFSDNSSWWIIFPLTTGIVIGSLIKKVIQ